MIAPSLGVHVWLACGFTDMRKGFDGLASLAQQQLGKHPFRGQLFGFRGRHSRLRWKPLLSGGLASSGRAGPQRSR